MKDKPYRIWIKKKKTMIDKEKSNIMLNFDWLISLKVLASLKNIACQEVSSNMLSS